MKKIALGMLAAVALASSYTVALAIDVTAVRVTYIDRDAGVILLNNGDSITPPAGFDLATLAVGLRVNATYNNSGTGPFAATALRVFAEAG